MANHGSKTLIAALLGLLQGNSLTLQKGSISFNGFKCEISVYLFQYGDTIHTFVERKDYTGPFLPGYQLTKTKDALLEKL